MFREHLRRTSCGWSSIAGQIVIPPSPLTLTDWRAGTALYGFTNPNDARWRSEIMRLIIRCAKCNRKVMPAVTDIAERHGAGLPVWRAIRPRRHRRLDGIS